jgi:hypothetical protein
MTAPGTFCRLVAWKYTDVSEVLTAMRFIALYMEAVSNSETSVYFYESRIGNIPRD